jgi:hypothetical protein
MNETTENFWKAMLEWVPPEPKPIFYRLYYNNDGTPIAYSMEDLPHACIDVTPEIFQNANMNVQVINQQLIFKKSLTINKLQPADHGTACDPRDVSVVVSADQPNCKWAIVNDKIN